MYALDANRAYPCRYNDMIRSFGRPVPEICMITNAVVDHLYEIHGHRISEWNHRIFYPASLEVYADAIRRKELHWIAVLVL